MSGICSYQLPPHWLGGYSISRHFSLESHLKWLSNCRTSSPPYLMRQNGPITRYWNFQYFCFKTAPPATDVLSHPSHEISCLPDFLTKVFPTVLLSIFCSVIKCSWEESPLYIWDDNSKSLSSSFPFMFPILQFNYAAWIIILSYLPDGALLPVAAYYILWCIEYIMTLLSWYLFKLLRCPITPVHTGRSLISSSLDSSPGLC